MYTKFNVETWVESAMRYFTSRNFRVVDADGKVRISNGSTDGVIYTPNNINSQYEVHCFTQNYKVKVTIK